MSRQENSPSIAKGGPVLVFLATPAQGAVPGDSVAAADSNPASAGAHEQLPVLEEDESFVNEGDITPWCADG